MRHRSVAVATTAEAVSAPAGVATLALDGIVIWKGSHGSTLIETGLPFEDFWLLEDRAAVRLALSSAKSTGHGQFLARPTRGHGAKLCVTLEMRRDARGAPAEIVAVWSQAPRDDIDIGAVAAELDITNRKQIEATQRRLLECSRVTGQQFFGALVRAISECLNVRRVYIAELRQDKPGVLRTLAVVENGHPAPSMEFSADGTPCAEVIAGASTFIARGLLQRYQECELLRPGLAESYVGSPLVASDGSILGLIGVLHDQPLDEDQQPQSIVELFAGRAAAELERLRAEASLRQSEFRYRIITDAIPALIAYVDSERRYQFANAAYGNWFGLDPSGMVAHKMWDALGQDAFAKIKPYVERALRGEQVTFEAHIPYLLGGHRHVQADYIPHIQDGRVLGYFSFVYDLTARKTSEEALRKSEEQFRTLFEHLPVGAALVDRDGGILLENDVFGRLMPLAGDTKGAPGIFERACYPRGHDGSELPREKHPVHLALAGAVVRQAEFLCHYNDGRRIWLSLSAIPVRDDHNEVTGALVVVADIHSEKRAVERRTLLINELNHRVKNTLASVQSIASQTFRTSTLASDGLDAFEARLLALSDAHNLLTREGWEGANLKQIVALVLEPHNPGRNRLTTNGPGVRLNPPAALAFSMALHELATNAVKYGALSKCQGTVQLTWDIAASDEGRRLKLSWVERGGPLVIPPLRKGFGSRLIERSLAFELGSDTSIRFMPEGVECDINADLAEISG